MWHESGPHLGNVLQFRSLITTNDQGIERVAAQSIPADHKFLRLVDLVFEPGAAALTGFVDRAFALRDHTFQLQLPCSTDQLVTRIESC